MKNVIYQRLRALFVISLCICMLLGAGLTLTQFLGILLGIPSLVVESQRLLLKPVVAFAAAFGIFSFAASYFQPSSHRADEEEEEI